MRFDHAFFSRRRRPMKFYPALFSRQNDGAFKSSRTLNRPHLSARSGEEEDGGQVRGPMAGKTDKVAPLPPSFLPSCLSLVLTLFFLSLSLSHTWAFSSLSLFLSLSLGSIFYFCLYRICCQPMKKVLVVLCLS